MSLLVLAGILPVLVYIALQIPVVQTTIARKATDYVSTMIDGEIHVGKIAIALFNRVNLKDVYIVGADKDTLVSFKKLSVHISTNALTQGKVLINSINLQNGVFNYIAYKDSTNIINKTFRIKKKKEKKPIKLPEFYINDLNLKDFRFNYINHHKLGRDSAENVIKDPGCMNFADIRVSDITIYASHIRSDKSGVLTADLRRLLAKDKSGWEVKEFTGEIVWTQNEVRVNDLHLRDNFSDVRSRYLSFFSYKIGDISDFVDKIIMTSDFQNTFFDFRTLSKITPAMNGNDLKVYLTGPVTGPVRDLYGERLKISSENRMLDLDITARIQGLPDFRTSQMNATVHKLTTLNSELSATIGKFTKGKEPDFLKRIDSSETIVYRGTFDGTVDDFINEGILKTSSLGKIHYSANMDNRNERMKLSGRIVTDNLDISDIIGNSNIGDISIDSNFEMEYDKISRKTAVYLPDTYVRKFQFNNYSYSDITLRGRYSEDNLDVRVISHDPNISFILQGKNDIIDGQDSFSVYLDVPYANLHNLGLDKQNRTSEIGFRVIANITEETNRQTQQSDYFGSIIFRDINYTNDSRKYNVGDISLHSVAQNRKFSVLLNTPFLNLDYSGDFSIMALGRKINDLLKIKDINKIIAAIQDSSSNEEGHRKASLEINTTNIGDLLGIIAPSVRISDNSNIRMEIQDNLVLKLDSEIGYVTVGNTRLNGIKANLDNTSGKICLDLKCSDAEINHIMAENNSISAIIRDSIIDLDYTLNNTRYNNNSLNLKTSISFTHTPESRNITDIAIHDSEFRLKDRIFRISPSTVRLSDKLVGIKDFSIGGKDQSLTADGTLSEKTKDSLNVYLNNFDLSFLSSMFSNRLQATGIVNGEINMSRMFSKNPGIIMDLDGKGLTLFGRDLGNIKIMSKWSEMDKQFNLLLNNSVAGRNQLNVIGFYKPQSDFMNFTVAIDSLDVSYSEPFLTDLAKDMSGYISGDISISGNSKALYMKTDNILLDNIKFTPEYTGVPYTLNGKIRSSDRNISTENIIIQDDKGNTAFLDAEIMHNSFRNIFLNSRLTFRNLHCLKTNESDNDKFYGDVFATGDVSVTGFTNDLLLDFTCKTEDYTTLHVPLGSSSSASRTNLLSFTKADILKEKSDIPNRSNARKSKFQIKGKVEVNQYAKLLVEINKQMGDIIRCSGNGIIDLNMDSGTGLLDIRGDYTITEGNYTFVLMGLTSKDFIINSGANISFNGDIANTILNLGATYRTKASVSTLIGDKTAVESRRNIDCGIHMNGPLSNPQISFTIDIPDLDPITKGKTESALSSNDKIQKQFMALIISGSFIPDEQSGIVNNTTILYSNAGEIISNQFNNIFRQLDIPLDLGLNYQPGENGQTDLFDVALSYQAFNNRVLINGNVGTSQKTTSDWSGNFEAEVKIDKAGKFRAKLFTRSMDDYSNYLDNTQRSGFGFTIQDEFDDLGDLFRSIFYSRKRKEEYELKKIKEAEDDLLKESKAREHKIISPKSSGPDENYN